MKFPFLRNVALKGLVLFIVLVLLIGLIPADLLGKVTLYNHLFPGRPRLPFGETPQRSYNLSLYNLEAMFASHEISAKSGREDNFRVVVLGDSSVWGTLLHPEETLTGRLNAAGLQKCGKPVHFYNLGYPTISLVKDTLILQRALQDSTDMVIWVTSLEAFPIEKQFASPLAENNRSLLKHIPGGDDPTGKPASGLWDQTIFGRRRELADWARLQLYGIPWSTTGIDQDYPARYPAADIDLEPDETFHNLKPGDDLNAHLAWDVLEKGMAMIKEAGLPAMLINEPILISNGKNSLTRYNFYYPRWAYDTYRTELQKRARDAGWNYLDAWDLVPMDQFTNSAIHLTPAGEQKLAERLILGLTNQICR